MGYGPQKVRVFVSRTFDGESHDAVFRRSDDPAVWAIALPPDYNAGPSGRLLTWASVRITDRWGNKWRDCFKDTSGMNMVTFHGHGPDDGTPCSVLSTRAAYVTAALNDPTFMPATRVGSLITFSIEEVTVIDGSTVLPGDGLVLMFLNRPD